MAAGLSLSSDGLAMGEGLEEFVTFAEVRAWAPAAATLVVPVTMALQKASLACAAGAKAPSLKSGLTAFSPPADKAPLVKLGADLHAIVSAKTRKPRPDLGAPTSQGEAARILAKYLDTHPDSRADPIVRRAA